VSASPSPAITPVARNKPLNCLMALVTSLPMPGCPKWEPPAKQALDKQPERLQDSPAVSSPLLPLLGVPDLAARTSVMEARIPAPWKTSLQDQPP
jgi:hypothetical protein